MLRIKLCFLFLLVMLIVPAMAQDVKDAHSDSVLATPPKARIEFEDAVYDFGHFSISKSPKHKHTFVFKNTGNRNLIILQAISGCGCTTPKYTKDPIKPGQKGKIVVTYDATGRQPGSFNRSVTVYTNDPRSYTRIFVKGVMEE